MAKKNYLSTDPQEARRKGRGNPNRNIHAKKKNSNYGGTAAAGGAAEKIVRKAEPTRRAPLPRKWKIALIVDLIAIMVVVILRMTPLKENLILGYGMTLLLGVSCGGFFYYRKVYTPAEKRDTFFNVLQVILFVVAVFYSFMGVMGFARLWG